MSEDKLKRGGRRQAFRMTEQQRQAVIKSLNDFTQNQPKVVKGANAIAGVFPELKAAFENCENWKMLYPIFVQGLRDGSDNDSPPQIPAENTFVSWCRDALLEEKRKARRERLLKKKPEGNGSNGQKLKSPWQATVEIATRLKQLDGWPGDTKEMITTLKALLADAQRAEKTNGKARKEFRARVEPVMVTIGINMLQLAHKFWEGQFETARDFDRLAASASLSAVKNSLAVAKDPSKLADEVNRVARGFAKKA